MKILYANGCSLTYGAELGGEILDENGRFVADLDPKYRMDHAWPNVLSTFLDMKLVNCAFGGSSNDRICRTTIDWTCRYLKKGYRSQDLFVVIAWSYPSRKEYKTEEGWIDILPAYPPVVEAHLNVHNFHVENFLDEIDDSIRTLQHILSLQSWLKTNQIPYLFCNGLHNMYHKKNETIENMLFHIDRKRYFKVDDYELCMHGEVRKFPKGPRGHPLEKGHEHWATLLYDCIIDKELQKHD